ncbi:cation transporter [Micromonospora sp. HNM0581]|uniref:cation diffusion facilitator family transporter n=1 Tax=Micromonospora sp. HNM0581 TaxID=2716341 RepID=UPI00146AF047|nr:cation transporter [Micromonospora sp. HNM0581]NLU79232.1 cation transporter [Micromonospora sp. HNM0581]
MSLTPVQSQPTAARRAVLARRVRLLVAATITYNVIEGIVAITAGTVASSTALIGFGLDSFIEVASAAAVAWQFAGRDPEAREKLALRVIAISFFALAAYVSVEAVRSLLGGADAEHSTIGLVLAGLSVLIMPVLSLAQRRAGRELGSRSAVADSRQTLLCTYLSAVLLVGLAVNSLFGWSWADPVAALFIAVVAVKEGREAWRGDTCCTIPVTPDTTTGNDPGTGNSAGTGNDASSGCGCKRGGSCCGEVEMTVRRTLRSDADQDRHSCTPTGVPDRRHHH